MTFPANTSAFFLSLFVATSLVCSDKLLAQPLQPTSLITILGSVYCDACYDDTFSRHSYFLPGVDVRVQCKFKASPPRTTEQISFSVNRTTDRYGMYEVGISSVDGVDCAEDPTVQTFCQASLIGSSVSACNMPSTRSTSTEMTVKSKQNNMCTYTLGALSYKPPRRNDSLCGNGVQGSTLANSLNSSEYFLPYIPPFVFPWPQWPPLPQLPPLPPLHSFPFPPLPPFPSFPYPPTPNPPAFPSPVPPITSPPSALSSPPPPASSLGDPRTLITPPPPPVFNFWDPRTWIPNNPLLSPPPPPPPPPTFNFWDPRTWIPRFPPSLPTNSSSQPP